MQLKTQSEDPTFSGSPNPEEQCASMALACSIRKEGLKGFYRGCKGFAGIYKGYYRALCPELSLSYHAEEGILVAVWQL